ncbi:MAG: glycerol-3-phosphate dehydrogenase [Pseudomonadota bacterium]
MSNSTISSQTYDLLVIGGGINGVGIARDGAGRGLKTCLVEMNDLASATSSWSTKLIHGGLRYLEQYEFKLVRESLIEREILLNAAPHLIEPLRFILPHHRGLRPAWLLRLGLYLYDTLGGRRLLPPTSKIDLKSGIYGMPLKAEYARGFEYSDCRADDARLVVVNAQDAAEHGADVLTRTKFVGAKRDGAIWRVTISMDGKKQTLTTRAIVNAAGPWVTSIFDNIEGAEPAKGLRLVKGSHIFTKQLFDHEKAYIFQHKDKRVVFAIPYGNDLTLVGTTDEPYEGDPSKAAISEEETTYLLEAVSQYFKRPVTQDDVVSTYSGVRPLFDDLSKDTAAKVTRDYAFDLQGEEGQAPLLSVYGGKLTTYRKLALDALNTLRDHLPEMGRSWTKEAPLPGGRMGYEGMAEWRTDMRSKYGFLPEAARERMISAYGFRLTRVLGNAVNREDLGQSFGGELYEAELRYMRDVEWARTAEDALNRRSKLYLVLSEDEQKAVQAWFDANPVETALAA